MKSRAKIARSVADPAAITKRSVVKDPAAVVVEDLSNPG